MSISSRNKRGFFSKQVPLFWCALVAAIASAGCEASEDTSGKEASSLTWEAYKADTLRTEDGVYIVNGNEPVLNEEELRKYYEQLVEETSDEGNIAVEQSALIVDRRFSYDNIWSLADRQNLTYCIASSDFTSAELSKLVSALNTATADWEAAVYNRINFIYKSGENSRCSETNTAVVFNVKKENLNPGGTEDGLVAAASFFPDYPRGHRRLRIDPRSFSTTWYSSAEFVGLIRHELGHVLGFRHEFLNPQSSCSESVKGGRMLTSFDQNSIMNYDFCDNSRSRIYLTASDKIGARSVYSDNAFNAMKGKMQAYPTGWDFGTPSSWTRVEGDFDGNGTTDYIRMSGTHYFVFLSNAGTFTPTIQAFPNGYDFGFPSPYVTLPGDFDGDGLSDFIRIGATDFHVFYSNGNGTFTIVSSVIPNGWNFGVGNTKDFTGDFNRDGVTDIVRLFSNNEFRFVFHTNRTYETAQFALPSSWPAFGGPDNYETIPFDLYGVGLNAYMILGADRYYMVYYTDYALTRKTYSYSYGNGWNFGMPSNYETITGDFDGDHDTDFIRLHGTAYYLFLNNGNGTFATANIAYGNGWNFGFPSHFETKTGDFNGDDLTDFVRMSGTHAFTFISNGNGTFTPVGEAFPYNWDFGMPSPFETFIGDFSGDGKDAIERVSGTHQFMLYR